MKYILFLFFYSLSVVLASDYYGPQKEILRNIETSAETRIHNGHNAERFQFPYQASLQWSETDEDFSHYCGAIIITEDVVLTTAHCIDPNGTTIVVAGIYKLDENSTTRQERGVKDVKIHPKWGGGYDVQPYDIALIKLSDPFEWNEALLPVALPLTNETHGDVAVFSGWGRLNSTTTLPSPNNLQYVYVDVLTFDECVDVLTSIDGTSEPFDRTMICTSGAHNVSCCGGDSGGPLVQDGTVIGIVCWTIIPCGTLGAPTVYTSVPYFLDFILQTIEDWLF